MLNLAMPHHAGNNMQHRRVLVVKGLRQNFRDQSGERRRLLDGEDFQTSFARPLPFRVKVFARPPTASRQPTA